jgi:fumarate reductase subunit C
LSKKSKIPAKFDFWQSATGLILGIFIIFHLTFESSILIGQGFFNFIAETLELGFIFEGGKPIVISYLAAFIFAVFIFHAFLAMRKFPQQYAQFRIFKQHSKSLKHTDTSIWLVQIVTGFILFFTGSVHLYQKAVANEPITAIESSSTMTDEMMAPLFIVLLIAVVLHAFVGLYRLAVKWVPMDKDKRVKLMKMRNIAIAVFLVLGLASIFRYIQIGLAH